MKKIFAAVIAMLFAASTSVYAAKHMPAEKDKDGKAAKSAATKDGKGAKDMKKGDKK